MAGVVLFKHFKHLAADPRRGSWPKSLIPKGKIRSFKACNSVIFIVYYIFTRTQEMKMSNPFDDNEFCHEYEEWSDAVERQFQDECRDRSLEDEATRIDYFNRLEMGV